jgi:hypothetical protein
MFCDDTTIIVQAHNKEETIVQTIKTLKKHMREHCNIKQIIIIDEASNDRTLPLIMKTINELADPRISMISQDNTGRPAIGLLIGLEQANTQNIITIDPELKTRLGRLKKQIKLLHKCDLVTPDRFHKESTNNMNKKQKTETIQENKKLQEQYQIRCNDINNENKAFKRKKLLNIIRKAKKTTKKSELWAITLAQANKKGLKTTNTPTHYIEKQQIDPLEGIRKIEF